MSDFTPTDRALPSPQWIKRHPLWQVGGPRSHAGSRFAKRPGAAREAGPPSEALDRATGLPINLSADRALCLALRRELGLPPERKIFRLDTTSGLATLGLWSNHYRPPAPDDPAHGMICGFPFFDPAPGVRQAPDDLVRFLDECERANDPPIVFTFGTLVARHARDLYAMGAQACRRLRRRAILLVPDASQVPMNLPRACACSSMRRILRSCRAAR